MYDAIIIGAGFGGLSAAALLAKKGKKVLLMEKSKYPGGRAFCFEKDGYVWQYGQHSHRLERDGFAAQVFARMGESIDFINTEGNRAYLYDKGRLYPRPEGAGDFLTTKLIPFRARMNFLKFYLKLLKQDPGEWYDKTLLAMYRTWYDDPEVERFLSFLGFTIMVPDPSLVSAGEVIHFLKRARKARVKQGEPIGGSKQIIDRLMGIIRNNGGEVHLGEAARSIIIKKGTAVGVKTGKKKYGGKTVVFAMPLFHLFSLAGAGHFGADFVSYVKKIEPSRGLSIDFVFDRPVTEIRGGILGIDLPLWVKFQTGIDPTVAPAGRHVNTWGLLFERGAPLNRETVKRTEAKIKKIMEEVMPGALKHVVRERKLVIPVINGNVLMPSQSYRFRPDVASRDVENLFFVGDTVKAEGCSGDIAFSSAMKMVDLLGERGL